MSDKQTKRTWTTLGDFGRSRVSCENVWNVWAVKLLAISQLSFSLRPPDLSTSTVLSSIAPGLLRRRTATKSWFYCPQTTTHSTHLATATKSRRLSVALVLYSVSSSWTVYTSRIKTWPVRWWLERLSRIYIFDLFKIQLYLTVCVSKFKHPPTRHNNNICSSCACGWCAVEVNIIICNILHGWRTHDKCYDRQSFTCLMTQCCYSLMWISVFVITIAMLDIRFNLWWFH